MSGRRALPDPRPSTCRLDPAIDAMIRMSSVMSENDEENHVIMNIIEQVIGKSSKTGSSKAT